MGTPWELRHPSADLARRYRAAGWWTDDTLSDIAFNGVVEAAASSCRVRSQVHPFTGRIGDLGDMGRRLAGGLTRRGIVAGDVVAFQLPNWAEAAACFYGLLALGVVVVPIVHIYGSKEVGHILRQSGARALITADHFARQDYVANLEAVLSELPDLELVVVVPADHAPLPELGIAALSWAQVLALADPLDRPARLDPDSPAIVGYTSGTTAAPKGVVHTHRTFLADQRTWATFLAEDASPAPSVRRTASLTASPVGHITGLSSVLSPLFSASALDLIDAWDPATVLVAMARDGVALGGGPPFFLISLLDHPDFDPAVHLPFMSRLTMGGAPIPAELARRAIDLGISLTRAYGSTEHPSTTGSLHSDPVAKRNFTDGRIMSGTEILLLDADGRPVPPGQPGEIRSRGPELFVGYIDAALTAEAIDADGWYDTGDAGFLDDDGYLTITDRKKDIIIRGGENISAAEVEGLMASMAGVAEVALVAAPDARYGEHGAAVIRLLPGSRPFDLAFVRAHLGAGGLARQKWPEEVRFVHDFPRTPSGKIQKNVLRSALRSGEQHVLPFETRSPDT
jgi:acyl-CoA synthetase (AMP-forming)/AMP-acid ligase II